MSDYADVKITCIFCEDGDLFRLPAGIADAPWPVCNLCAGAGRTLLDEGAMAPVVHCLHLVAMEIEAFAEAWATSDERRMKKWLYRIQRQMARGAFREACPCRSCMGQTDHLVATDAHDTFGIERETAADTMPLLVLRSMADGHKIKATDGSTWRAVDEIARRLEANAIETRYAMPGPLARRASPVGPREGAGVLPVPPGPKGRGRS